MPTSLVIHGHFYQPPRENPWTRQVEREISAHPDHDWNKRIHRECYRPNAFARIFDRFGLIARIVNNYAQLSFNFGPTLLSWLAETEPLTYNRVLDADRDSLKRLGHGNAIAQGFNHAILPLCNARDRVTQIRWGRADFRYRFGREAESLWLPETACDDATLGALIDEGLKYVILSPHQAERVRPLTGGEWRHVADGSVDPGVPYRYFHRDGSKRSIDIFFYDGPISRALAFEGILTSSQALVGRLRTAQGGEGRLVHVATDGESYGHHTHFGDRTVAHALLVEAPVQGFEVTNYAAFLEKHPPAMEAEIKPGPDGQGTSWSCIHGVGRWIRDCGCNTGSRPGWNQAWRAPLRQALDLLRDEIVKSFEETRDELFQDPWAARDAYINLLLDPDHSRGEFLREHAGHLLSSRHSERALLYLELQRLSMLMYTSCGWFFADLSGIETIQVLKYAGQALDLIEELDLTSPHDRFLDALSTAKSNQSEMGNGADIFRRFVNPLRVTPGRIAAHIAISSLVAEGDEEGQVAGHRYARTSFQQQTHGRRRDFAIASMHLGGVDFYSVARAFPGAQRFATSAQKLWSSFRTASLPRILRIAQEEFGPDEYGLESVMSEGKVKITQLVLRDVMRHFLEQYAYLYETHRRTLEMLQEAGLEFPKELQAAGEFTLSRRFDEQVKEAAGSRDPAAYHRAALIGEEAAQRGYQIDRSRAGVIFEEMIAEAVDLAVTEPTEETIESALALIEEAGWLRLESNLERAEEALYRSFEKSHEWPEPLWPLARALRFAISAAGPAPSESLHKNDKR
jgi:alpha-amylase/alpha-mannosidase (GH57 family)